MAPADCQGVFQSYLQPLHSNSPSRKLGMIPAPFILVIPIARSVIPKVHQLPLKGRPIRVGLVDELLRLGKPERPRRALKWPLCFANVGEPCRLWSRPPAVYAPFLAVHAASAPFLPPFPPYTDRDRVLPLLMVVCTKMCTKIFCPEMVFLHGGCESCSGLTEEAKNSVCG